MPSPSNVVYTKNISYMSEQRCGVLLHSRSSKKAPFLQTDAEQKVEEYKWAKFGKL